MLANFQMTTICLFVFAIIFPKQQQKNSYISGQRQKYRLKADEKEVDMVKGVELKAAGTDTVPDKIIFTMFLQTILSRTRVARGNVGTKKFKGEKKLSVDFRFYVFLACATFGNTFFCRSARLQQKPRRPVHCTAVL